MCVYNFYNYMLINPLSHFDSLIGPKIGWHFEALILESSTSVSPPSAIEALYHAIRFAFICKLPFPFRFPLRFLSWNVQACLQEFSELLLITFWAEDSKNSLNKRRIINVELAISQLWLGVWSGEDQILLWETSSGLNNSSVQFSDSGPSLEV